MKLALIRCHLSSARYGTCKPLADYTSGELEAKVDELEMILNTDIVGTHKAMGEYKKAEELEDEINMAKSMREQNGAQK